MPWKLPRRPLQSMKPSIRTTVTPSISWINSRVKREETFSISINEILQKLPERDRLIITWRFFEDKTQSVIAARLGLSQVQVSRLERQALSKIKSLMENS